MQPSLAELSVLFIILFVVFRALEWSRPRARRLPVLRRGFFTDLTYWAFAPFVTRYLGDISVALVLVPFALITYGSVDEKVILAGFGPAAQLPLWMQAVAILFIGDFVGYWTHRAFHGRRLWRLHAVHHSSVDLDWMSSMRQHPLNDALSRMAAIIPMLALGFAPLSVAAVMPVLTLFAILQHANLDWDFGPLRTVIASPRFHRWHHALEGTAPACNFAGLFPVIDIVFGTYHMPRGAPAERFGTLTPVPDGLFGQLLFPFSRRSPKV